MNGLDHHLAVDPQSTEILLTTPGNSSPEFEFATFVSLPRGQFANGRFRNNGAATIVGGYLPPSPSPTLHRLLVNIAFMEFPVSPDGSGVPDFGFIARVTLRNHPNFSGVPTDQIVVSGMPGPGRLLAEYHVASASRLHPVPISEFAFGFYAIPEPSAGVFFGLGALLYLRRRG